MGGSKKFIEAERLSRRKLLAWSSMSALGSVFSTQLLAAPDVDARVSNPSSDFDGVEDLIVSSIESSLRERVLPVSSGESSATIAIVLTDPSASFAIKTRSGQSEVVAAAEESDAGILVTTFTAHQLLVGQITATFALADRRISMVGDRRNLACLHHLPGIARPSYVAALKAADRSSLTEFDEEKVL